MTGHSEIDPAMRRRSVSGLPTMLERSVSIPASSLATTGVYLEATLAMKERALSKTNELPTIQNLSDPEIAGEAIE